jgi:hypothetical protein
VIVPDQVPAAFRVVSDAARRCADAVSLAAVAGAVGMWVAVRLEDGRTDGSVYDTREAAIRHQRGLSAYTPVRVAPGGMQVYEAEALLDYWRKLHQANVRNDDPGLLLPLMPLTRRDRRRQIRVLAKGRR